MVPHRVSLALSLVAALSLPGCQATDETAATLEKPFQDLRSSTLRTGELALDLEGPRRLADRAEDLLGSELERPGQIAGAAGRLAGGELERFSPAAEKAGSLAGSEAGRLQELPASPAFTYVDPARATGFAGKLPDQSVRVLGLDRRPLSEPDDPERRTDPADQRPPAGWLDRLLHRIWL